MTRDNIVRLSPGELAAFKKYQNLSDSALLLELRTFEREVTRLENADCFSQWAADQDLIAKAEAEIALISRYIRTIRKHLIQELA
jgi:hypothetical protein